VLSLSLTNERTSRQEEGHSLYPYICRLSVGKGVCGPANVVFVVLLYFQTFCFTYSGILGYMNVSDVKTRHHWSMKALIICVPLLTNTKTTVGRQPMHLRLNLSSKEQYFHI
jgi:hypothetical protein